MTRWLLVPLLALLQHTAFPETIHRELLVHFTKDRHVIEDTSRLLLSAFLEELDLSGDVVFQVDGHTDSDGGLSYNDTLARSRAEAVRAFLLERGVAPSAISISCSGERDPLVANTSALAMAKNRRVRLSYSRRAFKDIRDLEAAISEGSVVSFSMDPSQDIHWTGTEGTTLFIPAGTLVDERRQQVTATVSVEVTEALTARSVIGHELSTRCGDRLLETGGMVRVRATDELGNELSVRPGGSIRIEVPAPMQARDMQLFTSTDGRDWSPHRAMAWHAGDVHPGSWRTDRTTAQHPGQAAGLPGGPGWQAGPSIRSVPPDGTGASNASGPLSKCGIRYTSQGS